KAATLARTHSLFDTLCAPDYRARLDNWSKQTGVRNWTRGEFREELDAIPFSEDLAPLVRHPLVRNRGEWARYELLGHRLHTFCTFTEPLELGAVAPACGRLRLGAARFAVPAGLARDAGRVVIEEAFHAECAGDLKADMTRVTGVAPCRRRKPA